MIAIVDTGGANITSVVNAFARLGIESALTRDHETIAAAPHVILPGVGAAADSMRRLRDGQLVELICGLTHPVLGICLGMQLLFDRSLEGDTQCLGILPGAVEKSPGDIAQGVTIPHMGWNQLSATQGDNPLLADLPKDPWVYFVHSYYAPPGEWVVATTTHGITMPAMVQRDNFMGTQFHPERSGAVGAQLLRNFTRL